mgnify:FL=1
MGKWEKIGDYGGPLDAEDARESLPDDNGTARVVTKLRWFDYPLLAIGFFAIYAFWIVAFVVGAPIFAVASAIETTSELKEDAKRRNYEKRG